MPGGRALERTIVALDRYIAATQLGITLASLGLGWLGEPALARTLVPVCERLLEPGISGVAAHTVAFALALLGIAFLHVILGELVPKTVAIQAPDRVALWLVRPLRGFERVFRPFIWLLNGSGNLIVRAAGFSPPRGLQVQVHSVTELGHLVEASEQAGVLERQERDMVQGVLKFGDLTVERIMVPRAGIVSVRVTEPAERIIQAALESGYSRLPVYETSPDEVTGILNTKDLLSFMSETERGLMVVQDLVREPHFIRTGARLLDLLREFQQGEHHLALVLDDEGELVGLVTLEDLLEEIVGEIRDEYDTGEAPPPAGFSG